MKPIVCKQIGTALNVDITTLSGQVVTLKKDDSFSCTGEEIMAIQNKQVEIAKSVAQGEIVLEADIHLNMLTKIYDKPREWFTQNMNLSDIKTLFDQVSEELTSTQKNE